LYEVTGLRLGPDEFVGEESSDSDEDAIDNTDSPWSQITPVSRDDENETFTVLLNINP